MTVPRVTTALIRELTINNTLHHVVGHIALDLIDERERSEQVDKAFMDLQKEILTFMRKHADIPSRAGGSAGGCSSDGGAVERHRASDPQNIMANIIWLRDILEWAEERDGLAEAYENPSSERTT